MSGSRRSGNVVPLRLFHSGELVSLNPNGDFGCRLAALGLENPPFTAAWSEADRRTFQRGSEELRALAAASGDSWSRPRWDVLVRALAEAWRRVAARVPDAWPALRNARVDGAVDFTAPQVWGAVRLPDLLRDGRAISVSEQQKLVLSAIDFAMFAGDALAIARQGGPPACTNTGVDVALRRLQRATPPGVLPAVTPYGDPRRASSGAR